MTLKGLDIWLTTDPNDDIDWGDMGACCNFCGNDALDHSKDAKEDNTVWLWCGDCGNEFKFEYTPVDCTPQEPNCPHCEDLDLTCEHCGLGTD
jgi:hypothetical protein